MLLEKYRPRALRDVIGNAKQIAEIKGWLASWKKGDAIIVCGPPGCGKSLCVRLVAKELGYEIVESHAADERGYAGMRDLLKAAGQKSLLQKRKLIFIDELEMIDSIKGVTEIVNESPLPVVMATSNPYEQRLSQIRKRCRLCRFEKIRYDSIAAFLRSICSRESIDCSDAAIMQLAKACNGDVRSAVIDLECRSGAAPMYRDKEENVFETLKILFKTLNLGNSKYAIDTSEKPPEELLLWIEENIPSEYGSADDIASAYDCLSKADIVSSRIIRRQSWSLQKYFISRLCAVSFAKKESYKKFTAYAYPRMKAQRKSSGVPEKLSRMLHVSRRESMQYAKLILLLSESTDMSKLGLTDEDLADLRA